MTLPSSGAIKMSELRTILGPNDSNPISMSQYKTTGYGKGISGITDTNLSLSQFRGKSKPVTEETYNTPRWSSLTYTYSYNSVAFNWTAPYDCSIKSIKFYIGTGNNGTHVNIWTSEVTRSLSGFWLFLAYELMRNTPTAITYNNQSWGSNYFTTPLDTKITSGTILTIYVTTLATYNYLWYARDDSTGGMGFSITYKKS